MAKRKAKKIVRNRKAKQMLNQESLYLMFGTILLILLVLLVKFK